MLLLKPIRRHQGSADDAPSSEARLSPRSLSLRTRVCHPNTRTCVRLLGPCFKTGRLRPFRQHPRIACNSLPPAPARKGLRVVLPQQAPGSTIEYCNRTPQSRLLVPARVYKELTRRPTPPSPSLSPEAQTDADSPLTECTPNRLPNLTLSSQR